jgi:hypothetical protein
VDVVLLPWMHDERRSRKRGYGLRFLNAC